MATFTFTPSYSATETSRPAVRRIKFGDGYEHRIRFGLNTDLKEWRLNFDYRSDTERDQILDFLEARGGWDSFTWTDPHNRQSQYICEEWSSEHLGCNQNTITTTFREVPESQ